jgi:hypothetical protein
MPKLTSSEKDRFFKYLKEKGRLEEYKSKLPDIASPDVDYSDMQKLFEMMIADLIQKTSRTESKDTFEDYIFSSAVVVMENNLSDAEKHHLESDLSTIATSDEYLTLLVSYLSEYKNVEKFIGGLAFAYAKLAYKLQVEPNPEYVAIVEILELIKNLQN